MFYDTAVSPQLVVGVYFACVGIRWNLWWSYSYSGGSDTASPQCECASGGLGCPAVKISLGSRSTCMAYSPHQHSPALHDPRRKRAHVHKRGFFNMHSSTG